MICRLICLSLPWYELLFNLAHVLSVLLSCLCVNADPQASLFRIFSGDSTDDGAVIREQQKVMELHVACRELDSGEKVKRSAATCPRKVCDEIPLLPCDIFDSSGTDRIYRRNDFGFQILF